MVDHAGDERKAHDQFEHPVGLQLGGVEERGGRAAAGENDGDPILRRAARWLILKGQQHEHQQDGRRRLLALYGEGIDIDAATQRDLVERSEGISGAFIKAGPFRCPPRRRTDPADSGVRALHAPRLQHIDAHLRPVMLGP